MSSKNPSFLLSVRKLLSLLTFQEKLTWVKITGLGIIVSLLEVVTASVVIVLAQVLTQPESGKHYLVKIGFSENISPTRVVLYVAVISALVFLIKNTIAAGEMFFQHFSLQKINYNFKNRMLQRFAKIDYGYYLTRNSSYGVAVIGDIETLSLTGMICLMSIISEGLVVLSMVSMVVYLNPPLALYIFVIGGVIAVAITKGLFPLFYRWGQKVQESTQLAIQNLLQFFHGFKEVILTGKQEAFIDAYKVHSARVAKVNSIQGAMNTLPRLVIEVLFVLILVSLISYLCFQKDTPQQMIGVMGAYIYAGFRLMPGLNRIVSQMNTFKSSIPAIERLFNEFTAEATQAIYQDVPDLMFEKEISFNSVSFRYINTETNVITDVNFRIKKGDSVGIVGETGSGKSTLVDLMLGLLQPKSGQILIDGKFPVNSHQWHQKIGYVPQSIYLVDDTIASNIAFGEKEIDPSRLASAIDAAQLRKFVDQLPQGSLTLVGERGVRLSGGERQRVGIARALYHNPEVLIFDEATSALDSETEERLIETIYNLSKERTVIMIAHRLTTLKNCDRIIVMEKKTVSEIVSYDYLKARG